MKNPIKFFAVIILISQPFMTCNIIQASTNNYDDSLLVQGAMVASDAYTNVLENISELINDLSRKYNDYRLSVVLNPSDIGLGMGFLTNAISPNTVRSKIVANILGCTSTAFVNISTRQLISYSIALEHRSDIIEEIFYYAIGAIAGCASRIACNKAATIIGWITASNGPLEQK